MMLEMIVHIVMEGPTCSLLFSRAGRTSFTVLSTRTPPIMRKHRLSDSTPFNASITMLQKTDQKKKIIISYEDFHLNKFTALELEIKPSFL